MTSYEMKMICLIPFAPEAVCANISSYGTKCQNLTQKSIGTMILERQRRLSFVNAGPVQCVTRLPRGELRG
jgi:hypothetical protein